MRISRIIVALAACIVPLTAVVNIYAPLSTPQMNQVVNWGITELLLQNTDVCWKDSYGNTAGIPMTCAPGLSQEGALCYTQCQPGFYNTPAAAFCYQGCPANYRDDGLFCAKPGPYGRGAGRSCLHGWFQCDCNPDEELNGLMCYPKCQPGFHAVGCCICSPDCPGGWNDIGVSCTKPSHGRGIYPLTSCPAGYERNGALCYPTCRPGYYMVGPVCWKSCPSTQTTDCGALCSKDAGRCASATVDMIFSPITFVANILTFGAAGKVSAAKSVLTSALKLSATSTRRIKSLIDAGTYATNAALLLDGEIQLIVGAMESGSESLYPRLAAAYGPTNAVNALRQIAVAQAMVVLQQSFIDQGLTVAAIIDPTGVVGLVQTFNQPKCRDPQSPPAFPGLITQVPDGNPTPTRPPPPDFPTPVPTTPPPTQPPCPNACANPQVAVDCVPGTCTSTNIRGADNICPAYTCTRKPVCPGRDAVLATPCRYGNSTWNPVACSWDCPTTCMDGSAFRDCSGSKSSCSGLVRTICAAGHICEDNICGSSDSCSATCRFDPVHACVATPCDDPDFVNTNCEPNTCVADYSQGCGYQCTKKIAKICQPDGNTPVKTCPVGVATWSITSCSFECPDTCPDSTPIRTCPADCSVSNPCKQGYQCSTDYCHGDECQIKCDFIPIPQCTSDPCQSKEAQDGCIENTCTFNATATTGCTYACDLKEVPVTTVTFPITIPDTNATPSPTDAATSAPTDAATDAPTEAATDAPTTTPTEAATDAPTQVPTDAPTDAATVAPTDAATTAPTDAATSAPTDAATSAPTDAVTSAPTDAATSAPTDATTSVPTSAATSTSAPTDAATSAPTSAATSTPTKATTAAPTDKAAATSAPTKAATAAPTAKATAKPTTKATAKPTAKATSAPTKAITKAPPTLSPAQQLNALIARIIAQLRAIAKLANVLQYFVIRIDDIHSIGGNTCRVKVAMRGPTKLIRKNAMNQFLSVLQKQANVNKQGQAQIAAVDINDDIVINEDEYMSAQSCPDGSTIGVSASCQDQELVVIATPAVAASSSSTSTSTIIAIVIPVVVVSLLLAALAVFVIMRSRRHATVVNKMTTQMEGQEMQPNPAITA